MLTVLQSGLETVYSIIKVFGRQLHPTSLTFMQNTERIAYREDHDPRVSGGC